MVLSQGGVSGGLTIEDALAEFDSLGYQTQFVVREGGLVECETCHHASAPREVPLEHARRVEGSSDPDDMVFIGAVRCPRCGVEGSLVVHYGALTQGDDARVLRELDDQRHSTHEAHLPSTDHSLVRDSGWLPGPKDD